MSQQSYQIDDPIDKLEALLLDRGRIQVIIEMSVVDRHADEIEADRGEPFSIGFTVDYTRQYGDG